MQFIVDMQNSFDIIFIVLCIHYRVPWNYRLSFILETVFPIGFFNNSIAYMADGNETGSFPDEKSADH
jgi:hypothetical protein